MRRRKTLKGVLGDEEILTQHRFLRPGIRIWLPILMVVLVGFCGWIVTPTIRPLEFLLLVFLLYVAISSLVSVSEITVIKSGLIINRLLLPERFVPWSAIDRVLVFMGDDGEAEVQLEIASIGIYEGLSPLNRLPGLVYGQGFRQTIIIMPDMLENYTELLEHLMANCTVIKSGGR